MTKRSAEDMKPIEDTEDEDKLICETLTKGSAEHLLEEVKAYLNKTEMEGQSKFNFPVQYDENHYQQIQTYVNKVAQCKSTLHHLQERAYKDFCVIFPDREAGKDHYLWVNDAVPDILREHNQYLETLFKGCIRECEGYMTIKFFEMIRNEYPREGRDWAYLFWKHFLQTLVAWTKGSFPKMKKKYTKKGNGEIVDVHFTEYFSMLPCYNIDVLQQVVLFVRRMLTWCGGGDVLACELSYRLLCHLLDHIWGFGAVCVNTHLLRFNTLGGVLQLIERVMDSNDVMNDLFDRSLSWSRSLETRHTYCGILSDPVLGREYIYYAFRTRAIASSDCVVSMVLDIHMKSCSPHWPDAVEHIEVREDLRFVRLHGTQSFTYVSKLRRMSCRVEHRVDVHLFVGIQKVASFEFGEDFVNDQR